MNIEILAVPHDSGHENLRLGRGPGSLLEGGLARLLGRQGHDVSFRWVHGEAGFRAEIKTTFELCRVLAEQVRSIKCAGKFPLVVSGNCFMALGTIAGLGCADLGIVWFDSHGEYNTPETTISGFLDGMALAVATGDCWRMLAAGIPGFTPVPGERIVLVGGHDFDSEERSRLDRSRLVLVNAADIAARGARDALDGALDHLKKRGGRIYVHIDVDVLDAAEARANDWATAGGMSVQAVEEAVTLLRGPFEFAGVGLAGYDPLFDPEGSTRRAAFRVLASLLSVDPAGPTTPAKFG
jgi:arginase